jgi:hypothetical protein
VLTPFSINSFQCYALVALKGVDLQVPLTSTFSRTRENPRKIFALMAEQVPDADVDSIIERLLEGIKMLLS